MKNSFPARLATALLAAIASAAGLREYPRSRRYETGDPTWSSGHNKRAKSSFKQNKRRGL